MRITLNGKPFQWENSRSIRDLLDHCDLNPHVTLVEVNSCIQEKESYASVVLKDGDVVELIRFMGGGGN